MTSIPRSLNRANRATLTDASVDVLWSTETDADGAFVLPDGLSGHYFTISAVGDVASGGLPRRPTESTTIFNGDGYVIRLDLKDRAAPRLSAKVLGVPSLLADEITQAESRYSLLRFRNFGVSRFSPLLGMRNTVNTAFVPIAPDLEGRWKHARLLVAIDAGRPWEIDPVTLDPVTPVGRNDEWKGDGSLGLPFPTVFATAHPIWDPKTNEGFMVNFGKGMLEMPDTMPVMHEVHAAQKEVRSRTRAVLETVGLKRVVRLRDRIGNRLKSDAATVSTALSGSGNMLSTFFYLLRWDGLGDLQRWNLVDRATGVPVKVINSLHQVQVSESHIVVMDTGYQVGLNSLISQPTPNLQLADELLRDAVSRRPDPILRLYIIKRSDLEPGGAATGDPSGMQARVPCTVATLPAVSMHFTLDYAERDGKLWLTICHSSGTSIDGWVAQYDFLATDNSRPNPEVMGMLPAAAGLSRLAHYAIDPLTGGMSHCDLAMRDPFQWETALYGSSQGFTTLDIPDEVEATWWFGFGIWPEVATVAVLDQYADYPLRVTPREHVLSELRNGGRPSSLFRFDHGHGRILDHWIAEGDDRGCVLTAPQWVPRAGAEPDAEGRTAAFIVSVVYTAEERDAQGRCVPKAPQFWVFDAWDLARGPLCKLACPELRVGFAFHTAWLEDVAPWEAAYHVNVHQDYTSRFSPLTSGVVREVVKEALERFDASLREREERLGI